MSRLIEWVDGKVAKMRYFDVAATKLAVLFFALFLVKIWPPIICLDWALVSRFKFCRRRADHLPHL